MQVAGLAPFSITGRRVLSVVLAAAGVSGLAQAETAPMVLVVVEEAGSVPITAAMAVTASSSSGIRHEVRGED